MTWAGTAGPEGLLGVMTTITLTAEAKDFNTTSGPGPLDRWNYKYVQSASAPLLGEKPPTGSTTEVKSGSFGGPPLRCTKTVIFAKSPTAEGD